MHGLLVSDLLLLAAFILTEKLADLLKLLLVVVEPIALFDWL